MNLYPALQSQMGSWKYYIAKMKMKEVANEVDFAYDIYEDRTLSDAIQRDLNESRVKKEIVTFLARRKDRFVSSLVVAAIGGSPKFYAVKITDDPQFAVFADQSLDDSFGVLTFSGKQRYYALDGQHRLKAIKTLLDQNESLSRMAPEGFGDEEISVLIVLKRDEPEKQFLQSYRRLFSSLNRYAKPTTQDTNIIMDEDDAFAILTRRLISEYEFFRWTGKEKESPRVQTKGKNMKEGEAHFTSLQTLYSMNEMLLTSKARVSVGWGGGANGEKDVKTFKRFRPEEEYLDTLYQELQVYWNGLLKVLPVLKEDPSVHKNHLAEDKDNLLFWPIGQELLASVARRLLDEKLDGEVDVTIDRVSRALHPLARLDWNLHGPIWRFFLLTNIDDTWKMRSEGRTEALTAADRLLGWLVGLDELSGEDIEKMRGQWQGLLVPTQEANAVKATWSEIEKMRKRA
jgi:DNA sulfur modification protein DndB